MKRKLFIILFIIISFLSAGKNGVKEVYNSEMLIFQIDGSLDTVKFPIGEEGKNLNKELLKYLKFYDGKGNLIGDIIEKDEQIYIKFLVKIRPEDFFGKEVIMKNINNPGTIFIYPEGLGNGMIIRIITERGNIDTEISGNISRTKLLNGKIIEEERLEDKHIKREYNENGDLEKEEEYIPAYLKYKRKEVPDNKE